MAQPLLSHTCNTSLGSPNSHHSASQPNPESRCYAIGQERGPVRGSRWTTAWSCLRIMAGPPCCMGLHVVPTVRLMMMYGVASIGTHKYGVALDLTCIFRSGHLPRPIPSQKPEATLRRYLSAASSFPHVFSSSNGFSMPRAPGWQWVPASCLSIAGNILVIIVTGIARMRQERKIPHPNDVIGGQGLKLE